MKNFRNYFTGIAIVAMLFASCSKDETAGEPQVGDEMAAISLGAVLNDFIRNQDALKQSIPECSEDAPMYARVILTHDMGEEDVVVPINFDGTTYFTDYDEDLAIPIPANQTTTSVSLTDFWVYAVEPGESTMPIWVAPKVGSEYQNFVNNALPLNFDLRAGSKKYVDVEVLCFDDRDVNLYGYQFFDLVPTPLIKFCLFGNFCPSEDGRHYVAGYSVNVWSGSDNTGDQLYTDVMNDVTMDEGTGDYYSDPLCFFLPDTDGVDTYYFEITLENTTEYSSDEAGEIVLSGSITDDEIRMFYNEETGAMDYYHFSYGCGDDNPPPFTDPRVTTKRYKACLYEVGDTDAFGFSYLSLVGNQLTAQTWVPYMESNATTPQHIHENAYCADAGGVVWPLNLMDGSYPQSDGSGALYYSRTWTVSADDIADLGNLADRTVNLHDDADGSIISCGEYDSY
ncbi:hypothetical protein LB467_05405 [Salegentibacter sp. JZCK2]|uniref:hypothetical protein n=1 Tax=Salegentibacter tibetensis TaxID=2873600 RepID=UPI001CCC66AE|nr:hypothetical protein [Salegentibacter tibetensis]MBZ9729115.1 hypothetical protein [Salegentibacter tibetensis]